jgi:hypothetical protein
MNLGLAYRLSWMPPTTLYVNVYEYTSEFFLEITEDAGVEVEAKVVVTD